MARVEEIARALNTDACLSAFHCDEDLAQAVLDLDAARFEVAALEKLRNILPDGAEAQEAHERQSRLERGQPGAQLGEGTDAARVHAWFVSVGRAPLAAGVETLLFVKRLESRAAPLEQEMRKVSAACREVQGSRALQELLALIFNACVPGEGVADVAAMGATIQQLAVVAACAPGASLEPRTHAAARQAARAR